MRVSVRPLTGGALQPYPSLLNRAVEQEGVEVEAFSIARLLLDPPEVVHVHWPEHVLQIGRRGGRWRALGFLASIKVASWRGTALVHTVHNAAPHDLELGPFDRWFLRSFDRQVDVALTLTRAGWAEALARRPCLAGAHVVHTRHGHFRDAYPPSTLPEDARGALGLARRRPVVAFAGQVRPYKGVERLLDAHRGCDATLLVAGPCDDAALRDRLRRSSAAQPDVRLDLRQLDPTELAMVISAATVVAVPYDQVLNSGSVLLALSLDRPVLVPNTPTFRELRDEVGPAWVRLFERGRLSAADLQRALDQPAPDEPPDLERYSWPAVAAATVQAYRRGVELAARRRHAPRSALANQPEVAR